MIHVNGSEVDLLMPSKNISILPINVFPVFYDNNESESENKNMGPDKNIPVRKKTSNLDRYIMVTTAKAGSSRLYTMLLTTNMNLKKNF